MCVCVWWWCLAQWAGEQSIQKTPLQHQLIHQLSPLAAVTQVYPALCCSQHTSRANINISKLSVNSPLSISLSSYIGLSSAFSFSFFSLCCSLCLSVYPAGKTSLSWREGWQQWSGCKSHWLLVLDPVDGERANVIVQALVTVDTGSSEGGVI